MKSEDKRMKKTYRSVISVFSLCLIFACLFGCGKSGSYLDKLDESGFFANTTAEPISQTRVADMVRAHFADENGKTKKAVIIGFDGARAQGLYTVLCPSLTSDGDYARSPYSGFNKIFDMGGKLYVAEAGGIKGDKTKQQDTSTAPGWASILTGKLADEHGVYDNDCVLSESTPTVLLELAGQGKKVCFNYRWSTHYELTYKNEVAKNLDNYRWTKCETDEEIQKAMLGAVDSDTDLIFGIYENTDCTGHGISFNVENPAYAKAFVDIDRFAYQLIEHIESRETYKDEDWLIIAVTDHGGKGTGHGGQSVYERTIFLASNKEVV